MAGMGPAPKPDRARRNASVAMTRLPPEGRGKRNAPPWPLIPDIVLGVRHDLAAAKVDALELDLVELRESGLPTAPVERKLDAARETAAITAAQLREQRRLEALLWRDLWRTPHAVAWEQLGWYREVARYVRHTVMAELGDLDAAKEARQWSDRLGLSPLAMLRLRWVVAADEVGARRSGRPAAVPAPAAGAGEDPLAALRAV